MMLDNLALKSAPEEKETLREWLNKLLFYHQIRYTIIQRTAGAFQYQEIMSITDRHRGIQIGCEICMEKRRDVGRNYINHFRVWPGLTRFSWAVVFGALWKLGFMAWLMGWM